jgi:hypothetical protein
MFEVRVTPLIRGVPGIPEDEGGLTFIEEADTVLVPQFHGLRVERPLNDGCTGSVKLSMHWAHDEAVGDAVEALEALEQALWIGYWRAGEYLAETIFWGQCNVIDDFELEELELVGADPYAGKARSHYIRRGDPALNIDKERGSLPAHAFSAYEIFSAARNTPEQQDRLMPAFALADYYMDNFDEPEYEEAAPLEFERGQEVHGLHQLVLDSFDGPDMDVRPAFWFPAEFYAYAEHYRSPTNDIPIAGAPWLGNVLGRNLDPADPDDPQDGEVVFQMGMEGDPTLPAGLRDNIVACRVEPGKPITHQHYLDASREYRATVADAASSYKIGGWVGFSQADFTITKPTRTTPADVTALLLLARAVVTAYGVPPKQIKIKLRRPDLDGMFQYGHPAWTSTTPEGIPRTGGVWYLGDYVRVRARKGRRWLDKLARIVKVIFTQEGSNEPPEVNVDLIPAEGGSAGENTDHAEPATIPTVTITAPTGTVDGSEVIYADPEDDVGIASVEFRVDGIALATLTSGPWQVVWDTTLVPDGAHVLTALATDSAGNTALSPPVTVTVDNDVVVIPPVDPPPPGVNNIYYIDGRKIRRVDTDAVHSMRGMGMHGNNFVFGNENFEALATAGFTDLRYNLQWQDIETAPGVFDEAALDFVHTGIARAAAVGIGLRILALANDPNWSNRASYIPAWSYDADGPASPAVGFDRASMFCCLRSHGEAYLRKIVQEFGAYDNVYGFEACNEPDDTTAAAIQAGTQTMIEWMRDEPLSADKFFYITNRYSSQSAAPEFNSWGLFDYSHGDLIATVHSYIVPTGIGQTGWSPTTGMRSGPAAWWNGTPLATSYNTAYKSSMRAHFGPWKQLSQDRNIPVELGEVGIPYNACGGVGPGLTQRVNYLRDMTEAAELEEFCGVFLWLYGVSPTGNEWTASTVWPPDIRDEVLELAGFTTVLT